MLQPHLPNFSPTKSSQPYLPAFAHAVPFPRMAFLFPQTASEGFVLHNVERPDTISSLTPTRLGDPNIRPNSDPLYALYPPSTQQLLASLVSWSWPHSHLWTHPTVGSLWKSWDFTLSSFAGRGLREVRPQPLHWSDEEAKDPSGPELCLG